MRVSGFFTVSCSFLGIGVLGFTFPLKEGVIRSVLRGFDPLMGVFNFSDNCRWYRIVVLIHLE